MHSYIDILDTIYRHNHKQSRNSRGFSRGVLSSHERVDRTQGVEGLGTSLGKIGQIAVDYPGLGVRLSITINAWELLKVDKHGIPREWLRLWELGEPRFAESPVATMEVQYMFVTYHHTLGTDHQAGPAVRSKWRKLWKWAGTSICIHFKPQKIHDFVSTDADVNHLGFTVWAFSALVIRIKVSLRGRWFDSAWI